MAKKLKTMMLAMDQDTYKMLHQANTKFCDEVGISLTHQKFLLMLLKRYVTQQNKLKK